MPMQVCGGASNSASPAKKQWASVGVRAARGILNDPDSGVSQARFVIPDSTEGTRW